MYRLYVANAINLSHCTSPLILIPFVPFVQLAKLLSVPQRHIAQAKIFCHFLFNYINTFYIILALSLSLTSFPHLSLAPNFSSLHKTSALSESKFLESLKLRGYRIKHITSPLCIYIWPHIVFVCLMFVTINRYYLAKHHSPTFLSKKNTVQLYIKYRFTF